MTEYVIDISNLKYNVDVEFSWHDPYKKGCIVGTLSWLEQQYWPEPQSTGFTNENAVWGFFQHYGEATLQPGLSITLVTDIVIDEIVFLNCGKEIKSIKYC